MPIAKTPWIYKTIDKAINTFGKRHSITARQHFAPMLGYDGNNGSIQLGTVLNYITYNPHNPKPLSVDQLDILLEELGDDRKIILDAIAKRCDGVFNFNVEPRTSSESLKDELLTIAGFAGSLSSKFLEHKNDDGIIDDQEAEELERIAYETRQHLRAFEEMVAKSKNRKEEE